MPGIHLLPQARQRLAVEADTTTRQVILLFQSRVSEARFTPEEAAELGLVLIQTSKLFAVDGGLTLPRR